MAFTINLVALLIVIGLAYVGMMWLAGVVHRSRETQEGDDSATSPDV